MSNENLEKYIYANQLGIGCSKYDLFVDFINGSGEEEIIDKVRVNMSLPFVKILLKSLKKTINDYEKEYGEIKDFSNYNE